MENLAKAWSVAWLALLLSCSCTAEQPMFEPADLSPSFPSYPSVLMPLVRGLQLLAGNATPRIIQGVNARWDYSRHQASVRNRYRDERFFGAGHLCGGALITPSVVVSAAHCFVGLNSGLFLSIERYIVVLGTMNRFQRSPDMLIFSLAKLLSPSHLFDVVTFDQDIALLILNGSVPKNNMFVRPIKLHAASQLKNSFCEVTGWGQNEWGSFAETLKIVEIPFIDFETCQQNTKYNRSVILPGMLCAGDIFGGGDACHGDSGGPFVCRGKLAGIVSWGFLCGAAGYPGVYTDIVYYKGWITKQLQLHEANKYRPLKKERPIDEDLAKADSVIYSVADLGRTCLSFSVFAAVAVAATCI